MLAWQAFGNRAANVKFWDTGKCQAHPIGCAAQDMSISCRDGVVINAAIVGGAMPAATAEQSYERDPRKSRLARIIEEKSLIRGPEMRLASGAVSNFYFDMKPTTFDPEGANLIAELILDILSPGEIDLIGGLEMGAVPIVACVCQKSFGSRSIPGFFVRKQEKKHGTRRLIEGIAEIAANETLSNKRAVLLDDVTTTGGSVLKAVEAARREGCIVNQVITVVDRLEGAKENLGQHGVQLIALLTADDFAL